MTCSSCRYFSNILGTCNLGNNPKRFEDPPKECSDYSRYNGSSSSFKDVVDTMTLTPYWEYLAQVKGKLNRRVTGAFSKLLLIYASPNLAIFKCPYDNPIKELIKRVGKNVKTVIRVKYEENGLEASYLVLSKNEEYDLNFFRHEGFNLKPRTLSGAEFWHND